jgi:XTP/dITP diphosphohydrolase
MTNINLIFATSNQNKVLEIQKILPKKFNVKSLKDLNYFEDVPENETTIEGNAIFKARFIHEKFNINVFADDTGLEVEALNGEPGVHSARYAGTTRNSVKNIKKLLKNLKNIKNRNARFKTVIALIIDNKLRIFSGIVEGYILDSPKGNNGFGYDPIFCPNGFDKSFAELTLKEKNLISHRSLAMKKLIDFIS